jgi:olefin beta-lactone synthetase
VNVARLLREQAAARPDAPAIIEGTGDRCRVTTFAELDLAAGQAATLLWNEGLRPGDAVLVLQPMSTELYIALAAMFRLGLVATFLDPATGTAHIERCCALWPPRGLIASAKAQVLRLWCPALRRIPINFVIGLPVPGAISWKRYRQAAPSIQFHDHETEMRALLTFTSGTTGEPRAAVRSHLLLLAQHRALGRALDLHPSDVCLTALPIVLLANLASGVTSLLPGADLRRPDAFSVEPVLKQIEAHQATHVIGPPAFIERLATYCLQQNQTLGRLRQVFTGGGPVFPRLMDDVSRVAPQAELVAIYGSTEAEPIARLTAAALCPADRQAVRSGHGIPVGFPVPEVQLRIIADRPESPIGCCNTEDFLRLSQATGQVGEVVVSGDHVLSGYLHGQGDEETKIHVGDSIWHRTGDAGYLDAEGRLWLLGRCSACVRDERGTMYPLAVETAAHECAEIRRAAFTSHCGRRILVVELSSPGATFDLAAIERDLSWAQLDGIRVFARIPVDQRHNSKVDYPALRRLLAHSTF